MTNDQLDEDLDRLRAAHFQIPDPDPDRTREARCRVLTTIPDAQTISPAPATVLDAPAQPATRRTRRRSWWSFAGAAGALALAAVVVVAVLPDGASNSLDRAVPVGLASAQAAAQRACTTSVSSTDQTDQCLQALSVVAGDWNPPGAGDVLFQRTWNSTSIQYFDATGKSVTEPNGPGVWGVARGGYQDSWVAPDGAGRTQQYGEGAAFLPSPADRAGWKNAGSPPLTELAGNKPFTGQQLELGAPNGQRDWPAARAGSHLFDIGETQGLLDPADPLAGLSTDPDALFTQIRDLAWRQRIVIAKEPTCAKDLSDCRPPVRKDIESAFGTIAVGFLTYPATPRPLREALLSMLAQRPGYDTIGTTTDPAGRHGVAVRLPPGTNDGQDVLIIATQTARPIAEGISTDRTLSTTRWTHLFDLNTARVTTIGDHPTTP